MSRAASNRRGALRAGALAAAGMAGLVGVPDPADGSTALDAHAPPGWPALSLLDGSIWSSESWEGLAGVLVVWATWCPFCHRHNARVEMLHRAIAGRPMRVLGASLDLDPQRVRQHLQERGHTFPNTMETEPLRTRFGLRRITPTTVTFDRRGRILQRIPGEMAEADVMALARLAENPI